MSKTMSFGEMEQISGKKASAYIAKPTTVQNLDKS